MDDQIKEESAIEMGMNNNGSTHDNVTMPWNNNPANDLYFDHPNDVTPNVSVMMVNDQQPPSYIYSKSSASSKSTPAYAEQVVARRSSCIKLEHTLTTVCPIDDSRQQPDIANTSCNWSTNMTTPSLDNYFNKTQCDQVNCFCNYNNNTTFVPTDDTFVNSQYVTNSSNDFPSWMNGNSFYNHQQQPYVLPQKTSSLPYPQLSNSCYSSQPVQHNMTVNVPVVTNFQLNVNTHVPSQPPPPLTYPSTNSNVYPSQKYILSPYSNSGTFSNSQYNNQSQKQQTPHSYRTQTQPPPPPSSTFVTKKYNHLSYNTNRHMQKTFHREQPSHLRSWSSSLNYVCRDEYPMNVTSSTYTGNHQSSAMMENIYHQL
ncbi:unnamed protein product [Didymodactylos carnosus]|uniref:Uncharacterized protein n=1 Tax=Didymodactylos carnosus TaxID=1234261 RepID=A0A8S2R5V9_9BILA|nr:unnamed protein product [Didymodactylos carnosus]CAF4143787.1 unnamed protein product [Didymodactylos carnosus]